MVASGGGGASQAGQVAPGVDGTGGGADGGHGHGGSWIPTGKGAAGPNSSARYFGGGGGAPEFIRFKIKFFF